jgi:hypothetical protein
MASQKSRHLALTLLGVCFAAAAAYMLLVQGSNEKFRADVKAKDEVESFLRESQSCIKTHTDDDALLKKIRGLSVSDRKLIKASNFLPKRVDYFVVDRSKKQIVASISFHPDRGCTGIYISEPDFTSLN